MYLFDTRWHGQHGIGRFSIELAKRIDHVPANVWGRPMSPSDPLFSAARLIFEEKRAVYFTPGYNAPLFSSSPFVITVHDLNHLDTGAGLTRKLYYEVVLRRSIRRAAKVLTVSNYSRHRILEWTGVPEEHVVNVGNGVSEVFQPSGDRWGGGMSYLLCVGNRKPHKNEARVVKAFAASKISDDIVLVFNGDKSEELVTLASGLGVGARVRFLGRLDEEELAAVYRGAAGLVFPSLYEGFGLPVVEAMASGIPVLTSNVASLPEISGDAALYVDPLDIEAIAAGMERLICDTALRDRLVRAGIEKARSYSWDSVAGKVRTALDGVAEQLV